MSEILLWSVIFVLSLATLITAARFFTVAAEVVGLAFGMSRFAVGVIIVAIGTSLPELIAAIVAVIKDASEIVAGNVIGASVSNLFFVLAVAALFSKQTIQLGDAYILIDLNYMMGAVFLLSLMMLDGTVTLSEGVLGLAAYLAYMFYLFRESDTEKDILLDQPAEAGQARSTVSKKDVLILVLSAVLIYFGANYTIEALEHVAEGIGVSKAIISVTVLSIGTTLPEVVVSATAAMQDKGDIAVGNILGSCIFNSLAISGIASIVGAIHVPPELLRLPLPVFAAGTLLFYLLASYKNISRWEGVLFLIIYILFVLKVAGL
ncbi:MAG: calcium/sodium antiporter [Chloroherpetonaceae bacterium]|nr:calcium/sodium antiporter [Chloroherpetonaceae bacterium]MCS7210112.1 calcium/sodium antiporter [Chloroherpetonaceae bacterium]MDW8020566.1 calcium/sodium antiporter [Chloroherpetonaceae bacterium]MDW8467403.1 calcium/sodium antiporter [Chloroherpetonaceae bacterium]